MRQIEIQKQIGTGQNLTLEQRSFMSLESAQCLKTMRAACGWTQKDLAEKIGRHVRTIKYWEAQPGRIGGVAVSEMVEAFRDEGITEGMAPLLAAERGRRQQKLKAHRKQVVHYQTCDARTRRGTTCMCKPIPGKRRCKFHGGLSTGPRTPEGKARIAEAQRRAALKRKQTAAVNTAPKQQTAPGGVSSTSHCYAGEKPHLKSPFDGWAE